MFSAVWTAACVRRSSSTKNSPIDRKSTRLNSSHLGISYAVFCFAVHRYLLSSPTRRSSDLYVTEDTGDVFGGLDGRVRASVQQHKKLANRLHDGGLGLMILIVKQHHAPLGPACLGIEIGRAQV